MSVLWNITDKVVAPVETKVENVKWVRVVTGGGGGGAWPGFSAVIEVDGKNGVVAKGTFKLAAGEKTKENPVGATVFACHWDGGVTELKAADAIMLETSQDM